MKVPFVDLKAQYHNIKSEIDEAIMSIIDNNAFIGGINNKYTKDFENDFAQYLGVKHCISCANGTDSLEILLKAFGIKWGDEVIVPAVSWISTSEAVTAVGATPVFVDIHPVNYTIDIEHIKKKITKKTRAIIPVHLYGLPAEMDEIMSIAYKQDLIVIEDCAQAHGAVYKGKMVGTIGNAGSFSFYPGKNLGAYGDAGCMVTDNDDIATTVRMISNHGQLKKNEHLFEGRNSRMDGIQSAVLSIKLKYLNMWNNSREINAALYSKYLIRGNIVLPISNSQVRHVYHLFVVQIVQRDEVQKILSNEGIETSIHYPYPLPMLPAYKRLKNSKNDYPNACSITSKILSLPMYPELSEDAIRYISELINKSLG